MNIATDTRPLVKSYDRSKKSWVVRRASEPVHNCKTEKEADEWIFERDIQQRVVRFFFHELRPTTAKLPKVRMLDAVRKARQS